MSAASGEIVMIGGYGVATGTVDCGPWFSKL